MILVQTEVHFPRTVPQVVPAGSPSLRGGDPLETSRDVNLDRELPSGLPLTEHHKAGLCGSTTTADPLLPSDAGGDSTIVPIRHTTACAEIPSARAATVEEEAHKVVFSWVAHLLSYPVDEPYTLVRIECCKGY